MFEEWCHLLEEAQFPDQVLTHHKKLEYLWITRHLNQCCWSFFIYLIWLCCNLGARNGKADALTHKEEYFETSKELPTTVIKAPTLSVGQLTPV